MTDLTNMAAAIGKANGYLRSTAGYGNVIGNTRDPWTDGFGAPVYAAEVLSLAGVDPAGTLRGLMINTAAAIFGSGRIAAASKYTADWSTETNPNDQTTSWQQAFDAVPGNQAGWQQIMTNGSTAAMAEAGLMLNEQGRRR